MASAVRVDCAGEPGGKAAVRGNSFAASACGVRRHPRPNRFGGGPAKIANWESRANLSNEISGCGSAESQFHAAGPRARDAQGCRASPPRYQTKRHARRSAMP
jgi:hypothetical protein